MEKITNLPDDRPWKVVIVDDEPRSRAIARRMLANHPNFKVIAECANGYDAVSAVTEHRPDLMLLDIQMPEMDGFGVLQRIKPEHLPIVAFLTAFDQYAVRAFEVHALDYLLKPFDGERFASMIERVEGRLARGDAIFYAEKIFALLGAMATASSYMERFVVRSRGKIRFIPIGEVDWIRAEDNYIRIHSGTSSYLERETLSGICPRLDPKKFVRVHRSVVVNVNSIQEVQVIDGEHELVLKTGVRVPLSRTYREGFFSRLGDTKGSPSAGEWNNI